ncbi:hypothetical protein IU500_06595 [Nocardia terpenica]|uniref:hypothetical protein n=1 Tax=Nocardia terpenica TaxID=455432 RepID=UPI0018946FE3|nr:hypothetical protein [Nocardia terpenica]MBF6060448.1 hypothetical protein [Nocardia terpenica]MBF6103708.1 hypothetical protein [Nocardia terpenica]MBF6111918.1 hypothetical protein [Nocardia terpenica]MBF6117929.1 hypothetical protein [Nocardia terpenica]MBF6155345.1 hypothetical protein [Nocardia terpenica]
MPYDRVDTHRPRHDRDAQIRRVFGDDLFTAPAVVRDLLTHTRASLSVEIEREAELFAEMLAVTPDYDHTPDDRTGRMRMRCGFAGASRRRRWF